ncbi:heme peroxidase [Thozetella sp. PMI_491]|nr:heme peroxidase [Thozetella sp. PMI_491]
MRSPLVLPVLFACVAYAAPHGEADTSPVAERQIGCPAVWTQIAADFKSSFVASDGSCTDDARAAIRLSFHDCFPGACDGSIVLSDECTTRPENQQLIGICGTIGNKAKQYGVSTADLVQFGTAMGIVSCPGGPVIPFKVGRTDSSTANPNGRMPAANADASSLISQFAARGFTALELVALVGAHSTAKNLGGVPLDSTDGRWDVKFYSETADGTAPASVPADQFLSNATQTSLMWRTFAASQVSWNAAFVPAMTKMSLLGNNVASLVDCTSVVIAAFA